MTFEHARAIADAILYEGYVLYPYRASSKKNQWRWQFGLLAPRAWSEAGGCESWVMQTECLVEASSPEPGAATATPLRVHGSVRALRVQRRTDTTDEGETTVWDEGVEVEVPFDHRLDVDSRTLEVQLPRERSQVAGSVRDLAALTLRITLSGEHVLFARSAMRLRVRVENLTPYADTSASRDAMIPSAIAGVHALIGVDGGMFISSVDPPELYAEASRACTNKGAFPVLAGASGRHDVMLASPIILYDHPAIAPESPGELCDGTEIDEILTLRTLTLTDEEKRDARRTDARAAAIVDRVDTMSAHTLAKLHGARRDAQPGQPVAHAPRLERGARVRLRPRRRADAQDMFLTGRIATVEETRHTVDGRAHVAVSLDDDPATELHRWYGRFLYFAPDEVELVDGVEAEAR